MMKEPKQQEPKIDDFEERVAAVEAQLEPSFYKYRDVAQIYMDHGHFPPVPKSKESDEQYKRDEYAIRLSYCKARGIPEDFANELMMIQGSLGIGIDTAMSLFKSAHPYAQFDVIEMSNTIHKMNVRVNPSKPWTLFKFSIVDAQDQGLLKKNNKNWEGYNNQQNMIAKNNYSFAIRALDRGCLHGMTITDTGFYEMDSIQTSFTNSVPKTESAPITISQLIPEAPKPAPLPIVEPVVEEIFEVVDLEEDLEMKEVDVSEVHQPEFYAEPVQTEIVNFSPPTKEEIEQIKQDKIAELPPPPDHVEVIDEEPIIEEPIKEKKSETKQTKKPDLKALNETKRVTLPELPIKKEITKPWPFQTMTITDESLLTEENFIRIGEDWFASVGLQESEELVITDQNIVAFEIALDPICPQLKAKIQEQFENLCNDPINRKDRLALLYHDACTMIENPPAMNLVDLAYFKLMINMVKGVEKMAEVMKGTNVKEDDRLEFMLKASNGKWTPKDCAWGLRYMLARGLI